MEAELEVTLVTWMVALGGLALMGLLMTLQAIAVVRPRAPWTIRNIYGGDPERHRPEGLLRLQPGLRLG